MGEQALTLVTIACMTPEEENRHLAIAEAELTREFPRVPPQAIHRAIEEEVREFAEAPIRDFVPLLVRRDVRDHLRESINCLFQHLPDRIGAEDREE